MSVTTIAPEMYVSARRGIACVRTLPTVDITMCGRLVNGPAVFGNPASPWSVREHCMGCATALRGEGRNECERVECDRTPAWVAIPYGMPERLCNFHVYTAPGRIALPA